MRIFFLSLLVCLTISACGTKGPLYLPEKQYPQKSKPQESEPQKSEPQEAK